jgi:hypothetical protein
LVAFRTKFESFKKIFCKEYGLADIDAVRTARNYDAQRQGEDNFDFIDRVYGMAHSSFKNAENKKVTLDINPRLTAMSTLKEGDPMPMGGDVFIQLLHATVEENARKTRQTSLGAYMSDTVRVVVASGLREPPLRAKVRRMLLQDKNAYDITSFVKEETLAQQPEGAPRSSNNRRNDRNKRNGNGNGVHAVDDDGSDDDQDGDAPEEDAVDKVTAKNSGRRQRGGANKQKQTANAASARSNTKPAEKKNGDNRRSVQCGYCKKNGHTTDRCFIKKFNDENNAAGRHFQTNARQPNVDHDLRDDRFSSSGNANGLW